MQRVFLVGRLTKTVKEMKVSKDGKTEYMENNVAVNLSKEEVNFYRVVCFSKVAEIMQELEKGQPVIVEGDLQVKPFLTKDGEVKADLSVVVKRLYPLMDIKAEAKKEEEK